MTNGTQNLDNREGGQITIGACYASGLSFLKLLYPFTPIYKVVSETSDSDGKTRHCPKVRIIFNWYNLVTKNYSEDPTTDIYIEKNISIWLNDKQIAIDIINNFKSKAIVKNKRSTDYFF